MSLELSYKGLSDQIGVISPNLVRNPFFVADTTTTTLPSGWTVSATSASVSPVYSEGNALDGKSLVLSGNGFIKCDDFIKISGGTEMLGLYQSPLNFTLCVFLKGTESVSPTSGLKVEFFNDIDDLISSQTTYFSYNVDFSLKTALITLDDSDFDTDYKLKIKLTNMLSDKTIQIKLLSLTPGDVAPNFFLPSGLTEETLNSIKNKTLTLTGSGSPVVYDGSSQKSLNVVNTITTSSGLSTNSTAVGNISITNTGVTSIIGTANQVIASAATGSVTLTTPQSIGTASNVTFNNLILGGTVTSASNVSSTNGTFKARTGNVTGTAWTTHGWGKIGLASGSGAPSSGEATNPSAGDFFLRY